MSTIIDKISISRGIILEILNKYDWDTSSTPMLSINEIDRIYNIENHKNSIYSSFGIAAGCNFVLKHKLIPSHKLHVIYYNMPIGNQSSVKINKSLKKHILNLYTESLIDPDDSIIILVNEPMSDTIHNINDSINILLQENYDSPTDQIKDEMDLANINLSNSFFRYTTIFDIRYFLTNKLNHMLVPSHYPIRDLNKIEEILKESNATRSQMPSILKNDPMAKAIRLTPGDLCKIIRHTHEAGDIVYYRICK
jgi:DNA-directed RNA polymerase subunit H (RpoH/RPB5)